MKILGTVLLCVFCNVLAQLFLKTAASSRSVELEVSSEQLSSWWSILASGPCLAGIALWVLSTLLWIYVLSKAELSFAYALYGLNYVFTPLAAICYFKESFHSLQLAGMTLITLGVALTMLGRTMT